MFWTFILGILLIAIIVCAVTAIMTKASPDVRFGAIFVGGVLAVIMAVMLFFTSFKQVSATEVGVPVSFGTVGEPLDPGVHFVAPWVEVDTYPTRPVTVELSGDEKILARTADAGQMTVEIAARWQVHASKAKDLYLQVRTGDDDKISHDVVVKNLRQAVGVVYSGITNLDAINDRAKVSAAIKDQLQTQLNTYGIDVVDINMRSVEPDERTATTLAAFASQQQATRIATEAKKTATIEAERRKIEADGIKAAAAAVSGVTGTEAQVVCMQIWQQVVSKAVEAGQPVYTSPCGASATSVVAPSKQ